MFFLDWQGGLMLQQFLLNCRSGWGTINLRLRTPWHQSAQKADVPLAVLSAMLEEPRGAAGPGGMVGADFIISDFIFFHFVWHFKDGTFAPNWLPMAARAGEIGLHYPAITCSQPSLVKQAWREGCLYLLPALTYWEINVHLIRQNECL